MARCLQAANRAIPAVWKVQKVSLAGCEDGILELRKICSSAAVVARHPLPCKRRQPDMAVLTYLGPVARPQKRGMTNVMAVILVQ